MSVSHCASRRGGQKKKKENQKKQQGINTSFVNFDQTEAESSCAIRIYIIFLAVEIEIVFQCGDVPVLAKILETSTVVNKRQLGGHFSGKPTLVFSRWMHSQGYMHNTEHIPSNFHFSRACKDGSVANCAFRGRSFAVACVR